MDPGYVVGLGVLWVLFNLFARKGKQSGQQDRAAGLRPQLRRPAPLAPSTGSDPTQREGARLQDILRELGKTLDEASRQRQGQSTAGRVPTAKKTVAARKSRESTSEAKSLGEGVQRPERAVVNADEEVEAIVARRIAAVEMNLRPLGEADHQAFEARIRQEPADATAVKVYSMRGLRNAVVWREILGLPVSLREGSDS